MKKLLILFSFVLCVEFVFAQYTIKMGSVEIVDKNNYVTFKSNTTFIYFPTGFTLISEDKRIYSYLVPGIEFYKIDNLTFYDTGSILEDTLLFSKKFPVVVYKCTLKNKEVEVAQQVDSLSIYLMKRNLTGIKFFDKK